MTSHNHPNKKKIATSMEMAAWACIISVLNMQDAVELCLFPVSAMYNTEQQFKPQSGRSGGCFAGYSAEF